MSTRSFNQLGEVAAQAGSWRDLPPMDFVFYANTGTEEIRVEAFGCELMLSGLLSIDTESADLTTHKSSTWWQALTLCVSTACPFSQRRRARTDGVNHAGA